MKSSVPTSRPYILLVEDNEQDELLTLRAFARHRLDPPVVVARDGVEALDFLFRRGAYADRAPAHAPQVVLLDLKLPRLDGLDVLRAMRGHPETRLLPVVILTTSGEERDLAAVYGSGANSFVRKPVDFEEFTEAMRNLGVYWLTLNLAPPPSAAEAGPRAAR